MRAECCFYILYGESYVSEREAINAEPKRRIATWKDDKGRSPLRGIGKETRAVRETAYRHTVIKELAPETSRDSDRMLYAM